MQARPARGPAVFLSPGATYRADRCEALVDAVAQGEVDLRALARHGYPGAELPPAMLPEISSVGFWHATRAQSWGLDWHRNEGVELTYLSRGRLDFAVDGREHPLEAGHWTITRPWQQHRVGAPHVRASRLLWLILDVGVRRPNQEWRWPAWLILAPEDLRELTAHLRHNENPVWKADAQICHCFERLAPLVIVPDPATVQTRPQILLNELFLSLLELLRSHQSPLDANLSTSRRTVELFLARLPKHLEHSWTLEEMAAQCGLGRTRFADYCRQLTNVAPMDYLANCRVEAARALLWSEPARSITAIGFACGFQTSQYFTTVFRRRVGLSLREFRNR
jgi:AraC family L-rhamnose operon regulatory protein RhaS